jgi:hypothetical protein
MLKKLFIMLFAAVAITSCGGGERLSAEQTVVECWTRIAGGDFQGAVALMESNEQESGEYAMLLQEKYAAKLEKAGGLVRVDVLSEYSNENEAMIQAIVVLGNGAELEEVYALKRVDKEWIMGAYRAE